MVLCYCMKDSYFGTRYNSCLSGENVLGSQGILLHLRGLSGALLLYERRLFRH